MGSHQTLFFSPKFSKSNPLIPSEPGQNTHKFALIVTGDYLNIKPGNLSEKWNAGLWDLKSSVLQILIKLNRQMNIEIKLDLIVSKTQSRLLLEH